MTVDGSGSFGELESWSVTENATPIAPGDPAAGSGGVQFSGSAEDDSDFLTGDDYTLTHEAYGTVSGAITRADLGPLQASLSGDNLITRLSAVRTVPPGGKNPGDLIKEVFTPLSSGFLFRDAVVNPTNGLIYVKVINGPYIFRYSAEGEYLGFFGSNGSGNGQFLNSANEFYTGNIAVDPSTGNVYVVDQGNNRVQWFSPTGTYLGKFSETSPGKIAIADNRIYMTTRNVVGVSTQAVLRFNLNGTGRTVLNTNALGGGTFEHIAVTDNYIFVAQLDLSRWTKMTKAGVAQPWREQTFSLDATIPLMLTGFEDRVQIGVRLFGSNNNVTFTRGWQYRVGHEESELINSAVIFEHLENSTGSVLNQLPVSLEGDLISITGGTNSPTVRFYSADSPTPKLSRLFQNYLDSLDAGLTLDYRATNDPYIAAPGWSDSVWTKLNELCVAYGVEIGIDDGTIVIRDIGVGTLDTEDVTPVSRSISGEGASRFVDVQYTNATAGVGTVYDSAKDGQGRTFEVGVRETKIEPIQTTNYPVALQQPQRVNTFPLQPGQYYLIGSDNLPIAPNQFEVYGGSVTVNVSTTVPGGIDLNLTGPLIPIPGVPGPYRLAISDGSNAYPAFSVVGTGVFANPQTIRMSTGADWSKVTSEVNGQALSNTFLATRAQAWDRGRWAAVRASGPNASVTFSLSYENSNGFGLTAGSTFEAYEAISRVDSVSFGASGFQVQASLYTTFGDVQPLWDGETIGNFASAWDGKRIKDFRIRPLANAVD